MNIALAWKWINYPIWIKTTTTEEFFTLFSFPLRAWPGSRNHVIHIPESSIISNSSMNWKHIIICQNLEFMHQLNFNFRLFRCMPLRASKNNTFLCQDGAPEMSQQFRIQTVSTRFRNSAAWKVTLHWYRHSCHAIFPRQDHVSSSIQWIISVRRYGTTWK